MTTEYESDIQGRVLAHVRDVLGWFYIKHNPGAGGAPKGFPDTQIFVPGGRPVFMELKRVTGSVSPAQSLWYRRLRAMGYSVYTIRTFGHAIRILKGKYERAKRERAERAGRHPRDESGGRQRTGLIGH